MTVLKALTFSLTITAAAAKGYCNDRDSSCANWGKNGECEGDNADAVKNLCPHTCGVCRWRAPRWRRDHSHARRSLHTTVYVAASLLLVAPAPLALSASQTSAHRPRRPHRPHPDSWPRPRRSHACGDMESHCEAWAKSGECEKSPDYMKKAHTPPPSRLPFPASHSHAGSHSTAAPHTSAPLARPALAASPPSPPPSLTAQECPTACGLCNPVCSDLHDDCNHWYKEGACETNPWYMYLNCAVSCGVCKPMCKDKEGGCPPHASPRYQHPHTTPAHRLTAPPLPRPSPIPSATSPPVAHHTPGFGCSLGAGADSDLPPPPGERLPRLVLDGGVLQECRPHAAQVPELVLRLRGAWRLRERGRDLPAVHAAASREQDRGPCKDFNTTSCAIWVRGLQESGEGGEGGGPLFTGRSVDRRWTTSASSTPA